MRLQEVEIDSIAITQPIEKYAKPHTVVHLRISVSDRKRMEDENIRVFVSLPFDPNSSIDNIENSAIERARQILSAAASAETSLWKSLCAESKEFQDYSTDL